MNTYKIEAPDTHWPSLPYEREGAWIDVPKSLHKEYHRILNEKICRFIPATEEESKTLVKVVNMIHVYDEKCVIAHLDFPSFGTSGFVRGFYLTYLYSEFVEIRNWMFKQGFRGSPSNVELTYWDKRKPHV